MRAISSRGATVPPSRGRARDVVGGRYELRRRLAAGGMGEIWLAGDRGTGARVAVKLLHERAEDPRRTDVLRLQQEALLGTQLSHPHLARVLDFVESGDHIAVVMELLRGENLAEYLARRGPLPEPDAVHLGVAILSALAYLHERGIVHRDVTPSNVFLAREDDGTVVPKLIDLGIAHGGDKAFKTTTGVVLGTPAYLAPERLRGLAPNEPRSDLFAVAIILYEAIAGHHPFVRREAAMTLVAILEEPACPHTNISPRVWNVLRRALAKEPAERPPSAEALSVALVQALGGEPASTFGWSDVRASFEQSQSIVSIVPPPPEASSTADDEREPPAALGRPRPRLPWAAAGVLGALLLAVAAPRFRRAGADVLAAAPEPFAVAAAREDGAPLRPASTERGSAEATPSPSSPSPSSPSPSSSSPSSSSPSSPSPSSPSPSALAGSTSPGVLEAVRAERPAAPGRGAAPRSHAAGRSPPHARDKSSPPGDVTHRPDF